MSKGLVIGVGLIGAGVAVISETARRKSKKEYVGVVSKGGLIQTVYVDSKVGKIQKAITKDYEDGFDQGEDDARIFNRNGEEIISLFQEEEFYG